MRLKFKQKPSEVSISLPSSKSISNRLLILREVLQSDFEILNLSDSEDTQLLINALNQIREGKNSVIDVHHAGTDMRFLTAFLSFQKGDWLLTGSERMKQRPIGILVEALKSLGAEIEYIEKEGFPPLKIHGKKATNNFVEIDGSVSSQFISALLLIAPTLENGLTIKLKNQIVSSSYIQMTIELMKQMGVEVSLIKNEISVAHYKSKTINQKLSVESDWSAASYWYSTCALSKNSVIQLKGLKKNSLQGDSVLPAIYLSLGVETEFNSEGAIIRSNSHKSEKFEYDFISCPDIAQTVAVTCFALNIPARLSGLSTLKNKETDRILALKTELEKLGAQISNNADSICIHPSQTNSPDKLKTKNFQLKTYNDHRMAMSFAPLAIIFSEIEIDDPDVVVKSYPNFWNDLKKAGFET